MCVMEVRNVVYSYDSELEKPYLLSVYVEQYKHVIVDLCREFKELEEFNQTETIKMMTIDGFTDQFKWNYLFETFRAFSNAGKTFKS